MFEGFEGMRGYTIAGGPWAAGPGIKVYLLGVWEAKPPHVFINVVMATASYLLNVITTRIKD